MNCTEFATELSIAAHPSRLTHEHASTCKSCRALLEADDLLQVEPSSCPPMSHELRSALSRRSVPSAPYAVWRRAALPTSIAILALGVVVAWARRPDLGQAPAWLALLSFVGFVGSFAIGVWLVLGRDRAGHYASPLARIV
jgi:hypothetical protein